MTKKSLVSLFFSLLLASCARTEMLSSKPSSGNMVPYPASAVQNFMNSCTESDSQASCSCTIDKIQNRYSLEEFTLIGKKVSVSEQNLPDEIMDFAKKCSQENPNLRENSKPPSSVSYYEKLKRYFPDEGKKVVYQVSSGKTDGGIDVNYYVVISRDVIPHVTIVSVLAHEQNTDICKQWFSLDLMESGVYSLSNKKATPQELSGKAEMVYQALNESRVIIANSTSLSCKRFPLFLQDY
jgi:hypothetical protein